MTKLLDDNFYLHDDVVALSRSLLGKYLFTSQNGSVQGGYITETEAYRGPEDRASHAYNMRRTKRTEVMFQKGGICYVYLCYGVHHLLNVVTNQENIPHAILIRGIRTQDTNIVGPGNVTKALGIDMSFNGQSLLTKQRIWIEERSPVNGKIISSPRIGIDYAGKDALLPWRFILIA